MNKENKYYTPNLEEFHVGFEYEFDNTKNFFPQLRSDDQIECFIKDDTEFEGLKNYLDINAIRIKYLDQEDIESLGWNNHKLNNCTIEIYNNERRLDVYKSVTVLIYNKHKNIIFDGQIKNKSELKKLMQQLNIVE